MSFSFTLFDESFRDGLHYMTINLEASTGVRSQNAILNGQRFFTFDGQLFPKQYGWVIKSIVSVGRHRNDLSSVWMMVQVEPYFEGKKKLTKKQVTEFYTNTKEQQTRWKN